MADYAKITAWAVGVAAKRAAPFVLTAVGGFLAASYPIYHAALCGV